MEVTREQLQANIDLLPAHSDNVDEELCIVNLALSTVFSPYASTSTSASNNHDLAYNNNNVQKTSPEWWKQRQLADRYLTSFQTKSISWMVCDKLLQLEQGQLGLSISSNNNNNNNNINNTSSDALLRQQRYFFAAQTLHMKCCVDIHELPRESLPSLRDSLIVHLKHHSITSNDALTNRLGMCVSALAVQMGWITIITDLLSSPIDDERTYHAATMSILRSLPEECASDRLFLIDENTRYQMREHLVSSASTVFSNLLSLITKGTSIQLQPFTAINEIVFKVFFIWVRYVPIKASSLVETPLLTISIHGLTQPDYIELAADVVVEILHMYPSHHYDNEKLTNLMIPALLQLPWDDVLRSGQEDLMRVYCRVVTEMGESYMSLILSVEYQQASTLVEGVLRCTEISNAEISAITFHFWYRMVMHMEECEPFEWRQELVDFYTPLLLKLINIAVKSLMKYPTDIDGFDDDRIDDLNNHRLYVAETIEDCCRLLGGHLVLQQIGLVLKEEVSRLSGTQMIQWHGLESAFACLSALRKYVPKDEREIFPFCFQLIPQLPSEPPLLRFTACKLIGSFAFWLAGHPDLLQPLLPYLSQGLQIPGCASASSFAIKELCECSNQNLAMAEPVLLLYEEFTSPTQSRRLDLVDELHLLEGLCRALSRTIQDTMDDGRRYLNRLAHPVCNRFVLAVADSHSSSNAVLSEIDRLSTIIRFLLIPDVPGTPNPVLELLQSLWSILDSVTNRFPHETMVAEKICRFHKHSMRSCGAKAYAPMLQPLIQQLIRSFETTRQSPFLYAASICITEYGQDSMLYQPLYEMVAAMSNTAFSFLRTFEELTNHPDVVEELFYLMGRTMDYYADNFTLSPLLPSICQCAVVAMELDHQGAHKGTLKFLDCTVSYGMRIRDNSRPDNQAALLNLFSQGGQPIVTNLVRMLMGVFPSYSNQAQDVLWKLCKIYPTFSSQWVRASFEAASAVPERAKIEFVAAVEMGLEKDEFDMIVTAFRSTCERELRMRRLVQMQSR